MSNGLDVMKNARGKSKRTPPAMPPPRNKARVTPVDVEQVTSPPPADRGATNQTPRERHKPAETEASPPPAPAQPAVSQPASARDPRPLLRNTVYLNEAEDDFLQSVTAAGRRGTPKVTSAAAIIRFAVRHLENSMTPQEIVEAIRAAAPTDARPGRHVL